MSPNRGLARQLAREAVEQEQPLRWFEDLYSHAEKDPSSIPWADMTANPNLLTWLGTQCIRGTGRPALVVGCGLGDDAERLAELGFQVTAFDISRTCIQWCRQRFPNSPVHYAVADLFHSPSPWQRAFDFVFEAYTLQVLPPALRCVAMGHIAEYVAPGGTLLVVTRGRDEFEEPGEMPWPLLRGELAGLIQRGLNEAKFEDYVDAEDPPVRRFRVTYQR